MLGQTISHYKITEKLGAGGMGVVYKALDLKLERTVALKFLPSDLAVSTRDKASLLREARAASALDHPNIGVIHDIEESEDHRFFIVMAYYEGETLAQKLSRGLIPVRESLDLAIQMTRGLSAAHARNIVHRDIKPSNIIITKDNVAKIVDFGLARVVASISSTQSISSTGTLPYMSPEQILGEPIDQRADLWALGVILIQMISGSHPFVRPNQGAMTFAILNQPPAALDAIPTAVRPVAYRALSKKPEGRYPGAEEMLHDLEGALAEITSSPAPGEEPTVTHSVGARELKQYMQNASTPSWTASNPGKIRRLLLASVGVVLAAIAVSFLPSVRERFAGLAYAGSEKHIAVLQFANVGTDPEYEPVAKGLMDSMTNQLSNLDAAQQSLWVVPASVVRDRKVTDPASAFHVLGATMVVQGSVQRKGTSVHMTVVLIDAKRLRQIGSAELEDGAGDLAALQDQAVTHLARMMKVKVSQAGRATTVGATPGVYESYLKALGYMQRYDKPGNLDLAIAALDSAVKADARFALGYATLGEAYRLKYQTDHHAGWLTEAAVNCQKAIQIDDQLPGTHVTLGYLNISSAKKDLALQEFQRALDINPRDASAVMGLATVNESMDHNADAEANYKRAIALRPDYWDGYTALGNFYDRQNRPQEAIAEYRRVIELTPDNAEAYSNLGAEYMGINDSQSHAAAEAALRKSIQLAPNYAAYANLGSLHMIEKRYADSVIATRQALALNDKDWRVWSSLMVAYQWLRDDENYRMARAKTLALLEEYAAISHQEAAVQSALSTLYAEDKLREKALARVKDALALDPKNPIVLGDIAETYEDLGDRKLALQYAEQSLKYGSTLNDLQSRFALQGLLADPSFRSGGKQ
jgi:serine/threonine protein kinase/tetratricopeptide (TPR) repeat protein